MKDNDKVTLTVGQLKKLVTEAKINEARSYWRIKIYRSEDNLEKTLYVNNSLDELKKIGKNMEKQHLLLI